MNTVLGQKILIDVVCVIMILIGDEMNEIQCEFSNIINVM